MGSEGPCGAPTPRLCAYQVLTRLSRRLLSAALRGGLHCLHCAGEQTKAHHFLGSTPKQGQSQGLNASLPSASLFRAVGLPPAHSPSVVAAVSVTNVLRVCELISRQNPWRPDQPGAFCWCRSWPSHATPGASCRLPRRGRLPPSGHCYLASPSALSRPHPVTPTSRLRSLLSGLLAKHTGVSGPSFNSGCPTS